MGLSDDKQLQSEKLSCSHTLHGNGVASSCISTWKSVKLQIFRDILECWQIRWRKRKWMNNRALSGVSYEPTHLEHRANTLSHAVMILPSILAGELLLWSSECQEHITATRNSSLGLHNFTPSILHYEVSARIYGVSLVCLFLFSTLFHWVTWCKTNHPTKMLTLSDNCCDSSLWKFLHLCDRAIIFLFISGSYTPWLMLSPVHSSLEWLRWGIWFFAAAGITYSFLLLEKYKLLETLLYVAQGLLPALAVISTTDASHLYDLSVGGSFYMVGVLMFKSDGHIPCAHAIWHLFVAAGALSHFSACYSVLYHKSC